MPPRIEIAVYDLLPQSKISSAFYYLGCGIYHTAIRIPDLQVEYAYGGLLPSSSSASASSSSSKQRMEATGIFSIPSPEDHRIPERYMPGVRFVARIVVGEAFNPRWKRKYGNNPFLTRDKPLPPVPTSSTASRYPKRGKISRENSGSALLLGSEDAEEEYYPHHQHDLSVDTMCEPTTSSTTMLESPTSYDGSHHFKATSREADGETMDPPQRAHRQQRQRQRSDSYNSDISRIISIIENMKRERDWRATQYQLLTRNCNDFTNELCERLTGKGAPGWLNRAAWLGQSIPCLVPQEWLDPPSAEDVLSPSSSPHISHDPGASARDRRRRSSSGDAESLERPTSPLVAIPYLETQPMRLDIHYEGVK